MSLRRGYFFARRRAPNPARFQEQTEQVFKTTVFLSRLEDFAGMNEAIAHL